MIYCNSSKEIINEVIHMEKIKIACIRDVIMVESGSKRFTKGKIYEAEKNGKGFISAINDASQRHSLGYGEWFDEHFVIIEEIEKSKPSYVKKLLKEQKEILEKRVAHLEDRIEERKKMLQRDEEELRLVNKNLTEVLQALDN
jgi:Fe2+ transport system protein B